MTSTPDAPVADAVRGHWADRILPLSWRPYARMARLERPIGWWLLLWPCWWSSVMATNAAWQWPNLWHLVLFLIGAIAMRGAGCTYNDIVDRDLDASVARTRSRPIPSGQISVGRAKVFLAVQVAIGLAVLLQFNWFTVGLGAASLVVVAIYPFLKRVTDWPQLGLGLAFSWGALMGWAAVFGSLAWAPILLYAGAVAWTIGYDTIYALQDREDDALVGVRSTARLMGERTKPFVTLCYGAATLLFTGAVWLGSPGIFSYAGVFAGALHMVWQTRTLDINDPDACLRVFRSNRDYGALVFAGLVLDAVVMQVMLR